MKQVLLLFLFCILNSASGVFALEFATEKNEILYALPIDFTVDCSQGPQTTTYCYGNNDIETFLFTSNTPGFPVIVEFLSGTIESGFDEITVYDGADATGTVLFTGDNSGDLSGLSFQSTGDSIFIQVDSDGSVSCASGSQTEWEISYRCLTCTPPTVNFQFNSGCATGTGNFNIDVDVSDLGTTSTLSLTDNQGSVVQTTSAIGMFNFGPYPNGTDVIITVEDSNDPSCSVTSNSFTQEFCDILLVDCNEGPQSFNYCYANNDNQTFLFESNTPGFPVIVEFISGTIESGFDEITVYDGADATGTVLFTGDNDGDLAGLSFQSTDDSIFIQVNSDSIVSCESGSRTEWEISYRCLTCEPPTVNFNITSNCQSGNDEFFVNAEITDLGDVDSLNVSDNQGSTVQNTTSVGTFVFGPFTNGTDVVLTVEDAADISCVVNSPSLSQLDCPEFITVDCEAGTQSLTYCYDDNETETFSFSSTTGFPIFLEFNEGSIDAGDDSITIYDSADNSGAVLFTGDNGGDLSGVSVLSTGDSLFIEIESDGFGSCQSTDSFTEWDISYRCFTCVEPTANYDIISDCANGEQFLVEVNLSDTGDAESIEISDDQGSAVVTTTDTGLFLFGPFANGTDVNITISDADDVNCVLTSGVLSQAFCPEQACDIINAGEDLITGCGTTESVMLSATFMESALTNDTSVYNITDLNCPLANLDGTPTALNIDDRWSAPIDIEFNFEFFGITYNQLVVGANGLISFDTDLAGEFCPWSFEPDELLPTPDLPVNAIHGAYHDIDPSEGGNIEFAVVGTAPERQFKVSFVHVPHFSCNELLTTSQIILHESSNVIDVIVAEKPVCQTWNDGLAVIGIQNGTGTIGYTPPERNTGSWEVTEQELWRFVPDGDPNYIFEWFDADGNSLGNDVDISVNPIETTTYTASVTYTDANNIEFTVTDDVTVTVVDESPQAGPVMDLVNCSDAQGNAEFDLTSQNSVIINGETDLNVSYYESLADADTGTNKILNPTSYTNTDNPQTIFFRLERDISEDCFSTGSFNLVITDFDTNLVAFEQGCNGNVYEITISPIADSFDSATATYEWFGPVGADLSNNTNATFVATVDGEYSVNITTAEGCVYSVSTNVSNANCVFPQGISPNGDTFNDSFDLSAFNVSRLEIFNRNGRSVYTKQNYTNEWIGQSSNGELPVGTYYYVAELENNQTRNGWVYIQR